MWKRSHLIMRNFTKKRIALFSHSISNGINPENRKKKKKKWEWNNQWIKKRNHFCKWWFLEMKYIHLFLLLTENWSFNWNVNEWKKKKNTKGAKKSFFLLILSFKGNFASRNLTLKAFRNFFFFFISFTFE